MVLYYHFFKNFPVCYDPPKGFSIVSEAEVKAFLEFSCFFFFFFDPMDVSNLISGFSAFSKSSLYIWKFLVHILLKSSLKNLGHYFASMSNECKIIVWYLYL